MVHASSYGFLSQPQEVVNMSFYLWLGGIYLASVLTSYIVGRIGVSKVIADVQNLKNIHLQSPISVGASVA